MISDAEGPALEIVSSQAPDSAIEFLDNPPRLVIDLPHTKVLLARKRLETAGPPARLKLRAEPSAHAADQGAGRGDVGFVMIEVVDAAGRRVPDAEIALAAEVKGAGELIGFGSASPVAQGSYQSGTAKTWHGRALAIVRGKGGTGRVGLSVSGTGLAPAMTTLKLG